MAIPTKGDLEETKRNMDSIDEFMGSSDITLTDQYGNTRYTLEGINLNATVGYVGIWSELTGAYPTGASVSYSDGNYYTLAEDTIDITSIEPTISDRWVLMNVGSGSGSGSGNPKRRLIHRNNINHTHVEAINVSPVALPVNINTQPDSMACGLLDTVREELSLSTGDKYTKINDVIDARYFFLASTNVFNLDNAYTGNVTITLMPIGVGAEGVHDNCPALGDREWNTVSFNVTAETVFFHTSSGIYFNGVVKDISFTGGGDLHYEFDHKTFNYVGATWSDSSGNTLREAINRAYVRFYQRNDKTWISEDFLKLDEVTLFGTDVSRDGYVFTFVNADESSYVKMLPSERAYDVEAVVVIDDLDGAATVDDLSGVGYRVGRNIRAKYTGLQGDKFVIKRYSTNSSFTATVESASYVIGDYNG